jgi:hypothetical protein
MSGSFVVMNDRLAEVKRFALAVEAYAERERLTKATGMQHTVAYLPSDFSIKSQAGFDLVAHLEKRRD